MIVGHARRYCHVNRGRCRAYRRCEGCRLSLPRKFMRNLECRRGGLVGPGTLRSLQLRCATGPTSIAATALSELDAPASQPSSDLSPFLSTNRPSPESTTSTSSTIVACRPCESRHAYFSHHHLQGWPVRRRRKSNALDVDLLRLTAAPADLVDASKGQTPAPAWLHIPLLRRWSVIGSAIDEPRGLTSPRFGPFLLAETRRHAG